jgi:hypothetical protein
VCCTEQTPTTKKFPAQNMDIATVKQTLAENTVLWTNTNWEIYEKWLLDCETLNSMS